jgi:GT2 family glycosyltransferase
MEKKQISIILGSFNRLPFLPLTINSIRAELQDIVHEIIVVDGGSDDGSLDWLIQQKDIITIVQHNRGTWNDKPIERRTWGYFMNLGFKIAQGSYVCMLSDDCLVVPGAIINGIKHFDNILAQNRKIGALAFYWRDWSNKNTKYHIGCTLGNNMYVNHGMFLNDALKTVGYCDEETFFFYNGDGDLCLKMWQAGYECIDSPDSYIEHYPHANINVRKTNYVRFKNDLKNYLKKWTGIYYDSRTHIVGKQIEKEFYDHYNTGEQFELIHADIVQKNPSLTKPASFFKKLQQKIAWKLAAGKRKIRVWMNPTK